MTYVITGATGQLGRLAIDSLLERGTPPADIVATGRDVARLKELADRGVQVRTADYDDPETLRAAFTGASKVLLVSGSETGRRVAQHQHVIDAATSAGVELLAYTSIANADRAEMKLAADHRATEAALAASDLPHVLLRNNFYLDLYTDQVPVSLQTHAVAGSAGDGRLNAASRADLAEAAAAVLLRDDQAGKVYELGGDEAFSLPDLAAAIADASGQPVSYHDLDVDAYTELLVGVGVPDVMADLVADSHLGIARGELLTSSGDLHALLGRSPLSMPDAVRAAVAAAEASS